MYFMEPNQCKSQSFLMSAISALPVLAMFTQGYIPSQKCHWIWYETMTFRSKISIVISRNIYFNYNFFRHTCKLMLK